MKKRHFIPAINVPDELPAASIWFAFADNDLLVYETENDETIPALADFSLLELPVVRQHYLGALDGQPCFAVELSPEASPPPGMAFQNLRQLFGRLDEDFIALSGRAIQIVDWDRNHQFCSRCGAQTESVAGERAKVCPRCELHSYPRLSPSIIVRIRRGNEILLARGHKWPPGFYSVIAGFVEPGESLEDTVIREVDEEVGVRVKNIHYFGSQPWPFPNSLMLGFTADYAGGEIIPDETEIADAGWFRVDNLPNIPPKFSIARQMIDDFIETT